MPIEPKINVCIPYEPDANLGTECNRIMEESKQEWVLLLDHDALILKKYPDAGLFTIFGSAGGCRFQRLKAAPARNQSILLHRLFAKNIWKKFKYSCTVNDPNIPHQWISGFFMLTSKTAWKKAGGFGDNGLFAQDHLYHRRIVAAGLKCYRIDGIYCYHLLERVDGSWIPGLKTSKELWVEYWAAKAKAK
jgi:GT2 family glycosyltransferase